MTKTHIELYNEMINRGIIPCFELEDDFGAIYFEPTDKGFNVGTVANVGLLKDFEFIYDNEFSFDQNLQEMIYDAEEFYNNNK